MKHQRSKRKEEQEQKERTRNLVIGSIVAVLTLALVVWNRGFFQNSAAFTMDNQSFNANQVQLYYTDVMYSALMGSYSPAEGGEAFDLSLSTDAQMYSSDETWHDFISKEACLALATSYHYMELAKSEGFELPEEALAQLESTKEYLDTVWIGKTTTKKSYFNNYLGMSEEEYLAVEEMELYANHYQLNVYESFENTETELEDYYEENQDSLDVIHYSQLQYLYSEESNYDEDGVVIPFTEEEEAFYAGLKVMVSGEAESASTALQEGTSLEDVADAFGNYLNHSVINGTDPSSYFNGTSEVGAWLLDAEREDGDLALVEDTSGSNVYYSVLQYHGRDRAEELTVSVRHILVAGNQEEPNVTPTEEQWAASEIVAQEVLDTWVDSGLDLDVFSQLATENSADSNTASYGGIIDAVTVYDNRDEEVLAWMMDSSRSDGDYTMIKDETSYPMGYQIIYFDSVGDPMWKYSADSALREEKMIAWEDGIEEPLAAKITYGSALSSIPAQSFFG
ncbi:MAG: hypothetical protein R3Y63_03015 [Eubacteriales bacterium]